MYFLGAVTGSSGSCSNAWTGPSGLGVFAIPGGVKNIYLQPSASGVKFELGIATGISFQTTSGRSAFLNGPNLVNGPFPVPARVAYQDFPNVVAVFNETGGIVSVRVYGGTK